MGRSSFVLISAFVALAGPASGATFSLKHTLTGPTPGPPNTAGDEFGYSVDASGGTVIVGEPFAEVGGFFGNAGITFPDVGRAYLYDVETGTIRSELEAPLSRAQADDRLGFHVSLSGSTAIAAAPFGNTPGGAGNSGYVGVYDSPSGSLRFVIENPVPLENDFFGLSTDTDDARIVVGAPGPTVATSVGETGFAYVFDAQTGTAVATLANPRATVGGYFGGSVAIDGDFVAVGAEADDRDGARSGAAFVFDSGTGALLRELENPSPNSSDEFGSTIDISGGLAIVGAVGADEGGIQDSGAAFVFDVATGDLISRLSNPGAGGAFGRTVAISGDLAVVSAPEFGSDFRGMAYLFDAWTGQLLQTIGNPAPSAQDRFGGFNDGIGFDGDTIVFGARNDDTGGPITTGAAYIYTAAAIPLPAGLSLLLGGLGLLGAMGARRGRRSQAA